MIMIRLSRGGAKKKPFYHVVVTDKRNARNSGRIVEKVGFFNPMARGQDTYLKLEMDRITHWQKQGAQLSDRVLNLTKTFNKQGIIDGKTLAEKNSKKKPVKKPTPVETKEEEVTTKDEASSTAKSDAS